jgi:hypothetical protein
MATVRVVRELKHGEHRVALTAAGFSALVRDGYIDRLADGTGVTRAVNEIELSRAIPRRADREFDRWVAAHTT